MEKGLLKGKSARVGKKKGEGGEKKYQGKRLILFKI